MRKKWMYYITSLVCGICVMGVEMSATRLLSPYFGSTNLIWTVIICLIMVGLGAGSYLGGYLADKHKTPALLYRMIAVGGVWIALIPFISRFIILGGLSITESLPAQSSFLAAAIFSSVILFVPPLILLGMVSPYLAKLCVQDVEHTGVTLGRLQVLSTAGSIVGSVLPGFALIPWIGTRASFVVFAALLLLLCIVYWLSGRSMRSSAKSAGCALLILCSGMFSGTQIAIQKPLFETESAYQYLRVEKYSGYTMLSSGLFTYVQTAKPDNPDDQSGYCDALAALPTYFSGEDVRVLLIGYGGGNIPGLLKRYYDNVTCDCVEIDSKVVDIARAYFGADPGDNVTVDDGRRFLQATEDTYDIIMVDAYQDTSIPANLTTQEFFALCASRLNEGGVLALNVAAAGNFGSPLSRALGQTMRRSLENVYFSQISGANNALILGSGRAMPFQSGQDGFDEEAQPRTLGTALKELAQNTRVMPADGEIITDDRNNAELLQLDAYARTHR